MCFYQNTTVSLPVNNATLPWEYCDLSRGLPPLKIYTILPKVFTYSSNSLNAGVPTTFMVTGK